MPNPLTQTNGSVSYARKAAKTSASEAGQSTYTVGGQTFDTKTGDFISGQKTPSIVSSSSVITDKNKNDAMNNAGNNLTGPKNTIDTTPPDGSYYENGQLVKPGDTNYKAKTGGTSLTTTDINNVNNPLLQQAIDSSNASKKALEMTFNAALASNNAKYADLHKQLTTSYNNAIDVATDNAVALNPYSSSRGATTAANFKQKITDNYHTAAAQLESQADLAQQQLVAGNYAAYVEIQNSLDKTIADTISNTNKMIIDQRKQDEQTRQFEATFGMNEKNIAFDNAMNAFKTANYSPEDMQKMIDSGEIYGDPAFQNFFKASGSDPASIPGILNMLKGGSIAAAKLDLESKRVAISAQNANIAQANYYNKLSSSLPSPGQIVTSSNNVPVKLTDTQSQFFSMGQHLEKTANEIKTMLKDIPTDAITGWVTEKGFLVPKVQNELDPKQQQLMQKMYDLNNLFVYFSTGKQINETEFDRLSKQTASTKATPEYNNSALTNFSSTIQDRMDNYMRVNGWKIYGGSEAPQSKVEIPTNINDIFSKYGVNTK